MRIAIFTDTYAPQVNGVTKTLKKLKEHLEKSGIEYKFFVPAEGNPLDNGGTISFYSIRFHLYPECKIALPRYGEVKQALDSFKPDLIHLVTPFSVGLMGLKYARENNIPIVSSYHTNFVEYFKFYKLQILESFCWKYFVWFHSFSQINFCPSFDTLERLKKKGITNHTKPGKGGEIQLTDALQELTKREAMYAYSFKGRRYDVGDKQGFLEATVEFALRRPELREEFLSYLIEVTERESKTYVKSKAI